MPIIIVKGSDFDPTKKKKQNEENQNEYSSDEENNNKVHKKKKNNSMDMTDVLDFKVYRISKPNFIDGSTTTTLVGGEQFYDKQELNEPVDHLATRSNSQNQSNSSSKKSLEKPTLVQQMKAYHYKLRKWDQTHRNKHMLINALHDENEKYIKVKAGQSVIDLTAPPSLEETIRWAVDYVNLHEPSLINQIIEVDEKIKHFENDLMRTNQSLAVKKESEKLKAKGFVAIEGTTKGPTRSNLAQQLENLKQTGTENFLKSISTVLPSSPSCKTSRRYRPTEPSKPPPGNKRGNANLKNRVNFQATHATPDGSAPESLSMDSESHDDYTVQSVNSKSDIEGFDEHDHEHEHPPHLEGIVETDFPENDSVGTNPNTNTSIKQGKAEENEIKDGKEVKKDITPAPPSTQPKPQAPSGRKASARIVKFDQTSSSAKESSVSGATPTKSNQKEDGNSDPKQRRKSFASPTKPPSSSSNQISTHLKPTVKYSNSKVTDFFNSLKPSNKASGLDSALENLGGNDQTPAMQECMDLVKKKELAFKKSMDYTNKLFQQAQDKEQHLQSKVQHKFSNVKKDGQRLMNDFSNFRHSEEYYYDHSIQLQEEKNFYRMNNIQFKLQYLTKHLEKSNISPPKIGKRSNSPKRNNLNGNDSLTDNATINSSAPNSTLNSNYPTPNHSASATPRSVINKQKNHSDSNVAKLTISTSQAPGLAPIFAPLSIDSKEATSPRPGLPFIPKIDVSFGTNHDPEPQTLLAPKSIYEAPQSANMSVAGNSPSKADSHNTKSKNVHTNLDKLRRYAAQKQRKEEIKLLYEIKWYGLATMRIREYLKRMNNMAPICCFKLLIVLKHLINLHFEITVNLFYSLLLNQHVFLKEDFLKNIVHQVLDIIREGLNIGPEDFLAFLEENDLQPPPELLNQIRNSNNAMGTSNDHVSDDFVPVGAGIPKPDYEAIRLQLPLLMKSSIKQGIVSFAPEDQIQLISTEKTDDEEEGEDEEPFNLPDDDIPMENIESDDNIKTKKELDYDFNSSEAFLHSYLLSLHHNSLKKDGQLASENVEEMEEIRAPIFLPPGMGDFDFSI